MLAKKLEDAALEQRDLECLLRCLPLLDESARPWRHPQLQRKEHCENGGDCGYANSCTEDDGDHSGGRANARTRGELEAESELTELPAEIELST